MEVTNIWKKTYQWFGRATFHIPRFFCRISFFRVEPIHCVGWNSQPTWSYIRAATKISHRNHKNHYHVFCEKKTVRLWKYKNTYINKITFPFFILLPTTFPTSKLSSEIIFVWNSQIIQIIKWIMKMALKKFPNGLV